MIIQIFFRNLKKTINEHPKETPGNVLLVFSRTINYLIKVLSKKLLILKYEGQFDLPFLNMKFTCLLVNSFQPSRQKWDLQNNIDFWNEDQGGPEVSQFENEYEGPSLNFNLKVLKDLACVP